MSTQLFLWISRLARPVAGATALVVAILPSAGAQMPGTPVLQNAWAAPGIVLAVDAAGGSNGSVYAGAAAWAPSGGRFQLSGGAGVQSDSGSRGVYGARLAVPLMQLMGGKLGIAGFAGIGGGSGGSDSSASMLVAPGGVAVGYRQPIGTRGRGISAYVSPNYQYHSGDAGSAGYIRVGFGLDFGVTSKFGVTLGGESGANASPGEPGPRGTSYGLGISMKLGG